MNGARQRTGPLKLDCAARQNCYVVSVRMKEPYLSKFREMVRVGASSQDIHDVAASVGYAARSESGAEYVEREVGRVEAHKKSLLPLLEHFVGRAPAILDVGCNSGGTTVALALSAVLNAEEIIGVDPNLTALEAARVRVSGYDIPPGLVHFESIAPKAQLPFPDDRFDLTTCVSVLEFVTEQSAREHLISELVRITKRGGYIFLATPNSWRLREFHSRRLLGHFRRHEGYPWSSTPAAIRRMFHGCERIPLSAFVISNMLRQRNVPVFWNAPLVSCLASACLPWQKHLFRKRA